MKQPTNEPSDCCNIYLDNIFTKYDISTTLVITDLIYFSVFLQIDAAFAVDAIEVIKRTLYELIDSKKDVFKVID